MIPPLSTDDKQSSFLTSKNRKAIRDPYFIYSNSSASSPTKSTRHRNKTFAVSFISDGTIIVCVTRCSNKDRFDRRKARSISRDRLNYFLRYLLSNDRLSGRECEKLNRLGRFFLLFTPASLDATIAKLKESSLTRYQEAGKRFSIPLEILEYIQVLEERTLA